jgi:hypothetical protein
VDWCALYRSIIELPTGPALEEKVLLVDNDAVESVTKKLVSYQPDAMTFMLLV